LTFFSETNTDATTIDQRDAATGPLVGPLDAFETSWNAQKRTSAMFGIEKSFWEMDDQQVRTLRDAGVENIPELSPLAMKLTNNYSIGPEGSWRDYLDIARFYSKGGDPELATRLNEYDNSINEIKKKHPGLNLMTSRDMFYTLREQAQTLDRKESTDRRTIGGTIGGFIGGAISSFNPDTDPFNFVTSVVGGFGKTAVARIATEAGAQGLIETVNQVTGVQEQRDILGLSTGFADAAMRVGMTAAGGAAIQGVGEGLAAAGRRWFRNTKVDPAPDPTPLLLEYKPQVDPAVARDTWVNTRMQDTFGKDWQARAEKDKRGMFTKKYNSLLTEYDAREKITDALAAGGSYDEVAHLVSPLSNTRNGRARTMMDLDYMASRLEEWSGEPPIFVRPRTATAIPEPITGVKFGKILESAADNERTIDAMARRLDDRAFMQYDRLAEQKATYSRWLQEMRPDTKPIQDTVDEINMKIDRLKDRMNRVGNRRRAEMQKDVDALVAERTPHDELLAGRDTPSMAHIRNQLIQTDEKMRDLAPVLARAYAHAKGEWEADEPIREGIRQMIREGSSSLPSHPEFDFDEILPPSIFPKGLVDKAPILRDAPKVEDSMRVNADAADYAQKIVAENMKTLDDALTQYRSRIDAMLNEKESTIVVDGQEFKIDLDKDTIIVPHEDGTGGKSVTLREFLEDNAETEYELKAVQTCSIGKAT
jgi:hypothetical protein